MTSDLLQNVAKVALSAGHVRIIFPILVLTVIFHKRTPPVITACFSYFSMILNSVLKQYFKVPLFPHLGKGYSFPSGHMHLSCSFFGSVAMNYRNRVIRFVCFMLCLGEGFALYICRFHAVPEIIAGAACAALEILVFQLAKGRVHSQIVSAAAMLGCAVLTGIHHAFQESEPHIGLACFAFCGCLISMRGLKEVEIRSLMVKILAVVVTVVSAEVEARVLKRANLSERLRHEFRFFFGPLVVVWVAHFAGRISAALDRHRESSMDARTGES
jgi:hypothetical protein